MVVNPETLEFRPSAWRRWNFAEELKPQETTRIAQGTSLVTSGLTIAIALAVLIGWTFHFEVLKGFIPGSIAMNPVTAFCLATAGISLLLLRRRDAGEMQKLIGQMAASLVVLVGALRLISIFSGWDLGMERSLVPDYSGDGTGPTEQLVLRTALSFLLTGASLLLLDVQTRRGRRPAEILTAITAVIAILALVGYSYGLIGYYTTANYVPTSLPGAIGFLLLATGILLARARKGIMGIIVSDTAGGMLARRLIPLAILLPIFLGALAARRGKGGMVRNEVRRRARRDGFYRLVPGGGLVDRADLIPRRHRSEDCRGTRAPPQRGTRTARRRPDRRIGFSQQRSCSRRAKPKTISWPRSRTSFALRSRPC